jgi:hydroxymethylpyrimidine/phosphomethylpyrimidine kinase
VCTCRSSRNPRWSSGRRPLSAIQGAKTFVTAAIRTNPELGGGFGPVNMHADVPPAATT